MNRATKQNLERRLAEPPPVVPPADLLGRLRDDIPVVLPTAAAPRRPSWSGQRWGAAAAVLFVAAGAGWLARARWEQVEVVPEPPKQASASPDVRATAERGADQTIERISVPPPPPAPPLAAKPAPRMRVLPEREEAEAVAAPEIPETLAVDASLSEEVVGSAAGGVESGVIGGTPGGVIGGAPAPEAQIEERGASGPHGAAALRARQAPAVAPYTSAPPTTGGGRQPNDAPHGDMFFRNAGTNPFVDAEEDPLSTFGLDVDTGSYTLARRYLSEGHLPDADGVRVEEFVNAFAPAHDPLGDRDFTLRADGAETPFARGDDYRLVRFTIQARPVSPRQRKDAVLTFVVDTSGSMDRENRLELVKRALGILIDEMDLSAGGDRIGLVVYDDSARVVIEPTADHEAVRAALERLRPGGSTNAEDGLALGYEVAGRAYRSGATNRVILASDGVANVGATGPESILATIGAAARRGIQLTTIGFGMGNYNDALMEQLADQGDGAYAYVDTLEEARRVFRENLTATLQTVALDAKAQVEWNPDVVSRYRLLGYENRDIADRRFRDDSVDAGEIGAGHVVTALYEIRLRGREDLPRRLSDGPRAGTLRLRYRNPEERRTVEVSEDLFLRDLAPRWEAAAFDLRRAAVAAQFAELLKGSYWAKDDSWDELAREARRLESGGWHGEGRESERTGELAQLIERGRDLARSRQDLD